MAEQKININPGNAESLSGVEKAAILLLSLDENTALEMLKVLDEREIQRITTWAARIGKIPETVVDNVKQEFVTFTRGTQSLRGGENKEVIKRLLGRVMSEEKSQRIIEYIESGMEESEGLEDLMDLDPQSIAGFVAREHPQTIAIILAHTEPEMGAKVTQLLEEDLQGEVLTRLASLEKISPTVMTEINEVLQRELLQQATAKVSRVGGVDVTADIMNALDHSTGSQIMSKIEEADPELAERIRNSMFVFEDLVNLDSRGMQAIMKEVSNEVLTLALKTASDQMKEKIFSNISERASEMIKEELEVMGPVRLSEVERSQLEIVKTAQRLEEEGKITIGGKGGKEILV